jgi:hypothetical protein
MGVFWKEMLKTVEAPKKGEARHGGEDRIIKVFSCVWCSNYSNSDTIKVDEMGKTCRRHGKS